ncbi:hypothetical protein [Dermacoccus sp. SAI-028]|uniref:hypothetical protein n=1 Tax=Dermacoccus sp. SAI-028 TaxID=2768432 RepID=UPI00190F4F8D|nr:hypothetical protein [Dermacoccus sp. SAI-028]
MMVAVETRPTFSCVPEGDESTGQEAVELALAYGVGLDAWQCDIVRGVLRESGGGWAASQAGLVVGRQNGKGQIILALELAGLLLFDEQILHTAHAVKTSSDAFRRLWRIIEAHDDLARRVRRHSQQVGLEYVEFDTGARVAFTTRSASAGRGLSIDRLVIDEAEDLPAAEVGALAPTVFSRPRAQSLYFGTAPGPSHDSEAFATMRRAAHDGLNPRLAWWEWCAEYGDDVDDRALWARVNPAVASGRVPVQAIIDDRAVLPVDQFRAERLSMWLPTGGAGAFDAQEWDALCDPASSAVKALSIGVDAPPSRESATVCVAGLRADGALHVEWYETQEGVTWLPAWLAPRLGPKVRAVVVDARNPLAELEWRAAGIRPTLTGARDVAAAAGGLFDAVADGRVRHRGQVELTRGALGAKVRPMVGGQGFGWDRKAPGSSALIAASLALWGVEAPKPLRPRVSRPGEGRGAITVL